MAISLCHIDDVPEGGSVGFDLSRARLFAVKKNGEIHLYLNRCPHLGLPLDWEENAFLDSEGLYIKCANHGAFFIPETGECIQGPCRGEYLWEIGYTLESGRIIIREEELPAPVQPA